MKRIVTVTHAVEIDVEEDQFTPDFMQRFSQLLYPFDTIDDHMCHLAILATTGVVEPLDHYRPGDARAEGYGDLYRFVNQIKVLESSAEDKHAKVDIDRNW